jgi:hypothetical protein
MSDSFSYDAFLSHSAEDQAVVRPLAGLSHKDPSIAPAKLSPPFSKSPEAARVPGVQRLRFWCPRVGRCHRVE